MTVYLTFSIRLILTLPLLLGAGVAVALDRIDIALGDLQGEGWQARSLTLTLQLLPDAHHAGEISIAELSLPPLGRVDDVRVLCDRLVHGETGTSCAGRLRIAQVLGEPLTAAVKLVHDSVSGHLRLQVQNLALAGGVWTLDGQLREQGWSLQLAAQQVSGAALVALLKRLGQDIEQQVSARLDVTATLRGSAAGMESMQFHVAGTQLDFANSIGTQAGEKLAIDLSGKGRNAQGIWQAELDARFNAGAMFIDPLYIEFAADRAAHVHAAGVWDAQRQRLQLDTLALNHTGVAQATAELVLQFDRDAPLERVTAAIQQAQLPTAFDTYIQPWLRGQLGDEIKTSGQFSGRYAYQTGGATVVQLVLQDVAIDDPRRRFGFEKLSGSIDWGSDATPRVTELGWASGSLYRLALGRTQLAVKSQGMSFELREPFVVPLLDGLLMIDDLALSDPGGEDMRWRFDGVLTPVSMEAVCEALDWPRFGGQLSGMIPAVKYEDRKLEIGGVLLVKAFDGDLTVRNLLLEEPFGRVPRLAADLSIENLDLNALTSTFSFGKIEGRLSGYVNKLRMQAWQPVAFDARFATPEDDNSRHRISQKAVDNLSSIGGGVGGALSRSFLGVFEEFPYDRIGLGCRLDNGVCRMSGVAPAANGYYLVKGRFLPPRIDVVGYADRVDWHTLIDRLKSVTLEQGPSIQ